MLTKLVRLQVRQSNIKLLLKKTKNNEKTEKNRQLFSITKPKMIPTENRHLRKKPIPIPIPIDVKKSSPQGSTEMAWAPKDIASQKHRLEYFVDMVP
jgi:hypothetical protein